MAKYGVFDKSGTEAAAEREAAKMSERMGLADGKIDGSSDRWIGAGSFDLDIKHVGLGLAGNRTGNDPGQAHLLTGKRPEKPMQAPAGVFQCGNKSRPIGRGLEEGLFRDRKKIGHIDLFGAGGEFKHIEVINLRRARRGQSGAVRVRRSQFGGNGGALHGHQSGLRVAGFQPVSVVFDLGEVRVNRLHLRSRASEQGNANIER